ncbi:SRPBCC family protein [Ruicaihuangia caeni]|uniref:SRPBCC family protein n=1 Tax=Ruicaihuangia caeni TaxID=3042517 RepID=UPI00338EB42A
MADRDFSGAARTAGVCHHGATMATNYRLFHCRPEDVFAVLADGWNYAAWVVGTSRIRGVDETWPAPGAKLHHSFGLWPALVDDITVMVAWDPPRHAILKARGWPLGEASVRFDVREHPRGCVVRMGEDAAAGPMAKIPAALRQPGIRFRNSETLRRLAFLAEGRARS